MFIIFLISKNLSFSVFYLIESLNLNKTFVINDFFNVYFLSILKFSKVKLLDTTFTQGFFIKTHCF